jgi:Zn ribbon nucleic-acid-binding protein
MKEWPMWRESRTPLNTCPYCGHRHDRATIPIGDAAPKRGDVSVCIRCGGVGVFTRALRMRKPLPGEIAEMAADPELGPLLRRMQETVRQIPDDL